MTPRRMVSVLFFFCLAMSFQGEAFDEISQAGDAAFNESQSVEKASILKLEKCSCGGGKKKKRHHKS